MAAVYLAEDLRDGGQVAIRCCGERSPGSSARALRPGDPDTLSGFAPGDRTGAGCPRSRRRCTTTSCRMCRRNSSQRSARCERTLPLGRVLSIAGAMAGALDYAHSSSVLHRDIKPANILLDGERVVVCDFGVARAVEVAAGDTDLVQRAGAGHTGLHEPGAGDGQARSTGVLTSTRSGCVHLRDAGGRARLHRRDIPGGRGAGGHRRAAAPRFGSGRLLRTGPGGRASRWPRSRSGGQRDGAGEEVAGLCSERRRAASRDGELELRGVVEAAGARLQRALGVDHKLAIQPSANVDYRSFPQASQPAPRQTFIASTGFGRKPARAGDGLCISLLYYSTPPLALVMDQATGNDNSNCSRRFSRARARAPRSASPIPSAARTLTVRLRLGKAAASSPAAAVSRTAQRPGRPRRPPPGEQ